MTSPIQNLIASMLTENTGIAMMDSGGENGRAWQRNAGKTVADFLKEPEVSHEVETYQLASLNPREVEHAITFSVSTFHYLTSGILELDALCDEFNTIPAKDWNGEAYGVSEKGEAWLKAHGFTYGQSWNTYNGEYTLDRVLQGTNLKKDGERDPLEFPTYILLQIHGGADVRGGYTDAKMFKVNCDHGYGYLNPCPDVSGEIDGHCVSTRETGYSLKLEACDAHPEDEDGADPIVRPDSKIILELDRY